MTTLGQRINAIRIAENMNQKDFSNILKISSSYLSQLEGDTKQPSETLLELLIYRFHVNRDWLYEGKGSPVIKEKKDENIIKPLTKGDIFKRDALITACILGPVAPIISGGIAIGVGTAHILSKMCHAYRVKNSAKLAEKLGVDRSTIKYWIQQERIPEKYIHKSFEETELKPKDIIGNEDLIILSKSNLLKILTDFLKEKSNLSIKYQELETAIKYARNVNLS